MNLTAAQLTQLRTRPHSTKLWLSIFKPREILRAQINEPGIVKGDTVITTNLLSGVAANVLSGMTVYIGTTAGSKNLGRLRVKSATSTTITIAENSITWVNGWFLTVIRYFEPWGVYPRITLDANNVPQFFKDFDIPYTDQNQLMDPVVCMGPNHAIMLDPTVSGSYAQIYYSSSGSFDPTPGGAITAYDWHFEGAAPTGSTAADPGYVTYTGCGHFVTSLSLTNSAGKIFTGRRHISILARPERAQDGDCKPISHWGLEDLSGDRASGGWKAGVWIREAIGTEDIPDGSLAVIFTEDDRQGYVESKVGANAVNRDTILFTGYIDGETVLWDPETNRVNFTIEGLTAVMDKLATFSAALDDSLNAVNWNQMREMTVDRGVIHFLRWHSTVLAIADFSPTGDTKPVQYLDFSRGSVYKSVDGLLEGALVGQAVSDRQGKLWTEVDARVLTTGTARQIRDSMQNVLSVTRQDWRSRVSIRREPQDPTSFIELGGIAYSGPFSGSGTFTAHLSGAPGNAPGYYGKTDRSTGLVINGQNQLNELTGHVLAAQNADFPEILLPMAGDYRHIDIAPQHRVLMNLPATDNWLRVAMVNKPFIPQEIVYVHDVDNQVLLMDLKLTEETFGVPGDTIVIPAVPPYNFPGLDGFEFPPILPPPSIPLPSQPPTVVSTGKLVYLCTPTALVRSRNFGPSGTTSFTDISPASPGVTGTYKTFHLDPIDPKNVAYLVTNTDIGPYIYRTNNLNAATPTWTMIMSNLVWFSTFGQAFPGIDDRNQVRGLGISRQDSRRMYAIGRMIPGTDRVRCAVTFDGGGVWQDAGLPHPGVGNPTNTSAYIVNASEHLGGNAHALRPFAGNQDILFTTTQGVAWSVVEDDLGASAAQDFHIPFNANANDLIAYWGEGDGNTKKVYLSSAQFTSDVDITPTAQGSEWGCSRSSEGDDMHRAIRTWDQNALFVAAILQRSSASQLDSLYFFATDGQILQPTQIFTGRVTSLWWNKQNVNQLYMICTDDATNVSAIYFTENGGLSWINLFGDWYDSFGGTGLRRWANVPKDIPFTIQNVWTE